MLVSADVIFLCLLLLALVKFDPPRFKEALDHAAANPSPTQLRQRIRLLSGIFLILVDQAVYLSGYALVAAGLGVAHLYFAGSVGQWLNDKLAGIGTGLTMYATSFAVVVLLGRKQDIFGTALSASGTSPSPAVLQALNTLAADVDHNSTRLGALLTASVVIITLLVSILLVLIYAVFFNYR